MIKLTRTHSENTDFIQLVGVLDKELAKRDGDEHAFFAQFNKIALIKYVLIAYEKEEAIGCGAIKTYDETSMEIKRMFVKEQKRGKGIASQILKELEKWAGELGYTKCVLETGIRQPEAIRLYKKMAIY